MRDTFLLRKSLTHMFPLFKDDVQHDAADAYLSLLQCIPNADKLCSLKLRRFRSCVECARQRVLEVNEEWCVMLKRDGTNEKSLQHAINEWYEETSTIDYECECKLQNKVRNSNDPPEMYYTKHTDIFEVVIAPDILHIKVKQRYNMGRENEIKMATSFIFHDCEYILKAGMLYTGIGDQGHWRCIVHNEGRLIVFNNAREPVEGTLSDFSSGSDFIFLKKVTSEPPVDLAEEASFKKPQNITKSLPRNLWRNY